MSQAADNIVVVVKGASGMADNARAAVVGMGRIGGEKVITLVDESFSCASCGCCVFLLRHSLS